MEFFNQANQFEKKAFLQEKKAIPPLHPDARSQAPSPNEIWEELETVLARLRFFENHCVWLNTDGHAGADERAILRLTIKHMETLASR